MDHHRARLGVATLVVVLAGATWFSLSRRPTAQIEVCRSVLARNIDASAAKWRAHSRGEDEPHTDAEGSADDLARACAPLYSIASCRDAWLSGNEGDPSSRPRRLAETCRDAYCAKLSPQPSLCKREATNPTELTFMWRELDDAILSYELGDRAEPLHTLRRRGALEIEAAMEAYFDAGSPPWRNARGDMEVRALRSISDAGADR